MLMVKKGEVTGPLAKRMAQIDDKFKDKGHTGQKSSRAEETSKKSDRVCSIEGCQKEAARSLSKEKFESILKLLNLALKDDKSPRLFICQEHYKLVKKKNKKESKIVRPKFDKKTDAKAYSAGHMKRLD
jgi:hypothetical protein